MDVLIVLYKTTENSVINVKIICSYTLEPVKKCKMIVFTGKQTKLVVINVSGVNTDTD
jgi:predicted choloylglycine hydrolase